jgi:hypothetical protein
MNERVRQQSRALNRELQRARSDRRVLVVPATQYHALGGLTDETYQTRPAVLSRLLRERIENYEPPWKPPMKCIDCQRVTYEEYGECPHCGADALSKR